MTTEIRYDFVDDVSIPNNVLHHEMQRSDVAAGSWTLRRENWIHEARVICLRHVLRLIWDRAPDFEIWAVLGLGLLQPRSMRLTYYLRKDGLRGVFLRRGWAFSSDEFIDRVHEYDDGLRIVGATPCSEADVESVNEVMRNENAVILVIRKHKARAVIDAALSKHWSRLDVSRLRSRNWFAMLNLDADEPVAMIEAYGWFDDRDARVTVCGRKELLGELGIGG